MSKTTIRQRERESGITYVCGSATVEQQFDTEWSDENCRTDVLKSLHLYEYASLLLPVISKFIHIIEVMPVDTHRPAAVLTRPLRTMYVRIVSTQGGVRNVPVRADRWCKSAAPRMGTKRYGRIATQLYDSYGDARPIAMAFNPSVHR